MPIPQLKVTNALMWWGKVRYIYGNATFYIGALQLVLVALVAYNTTVRQWVLVYFHFELLFWQYVAVLVTISLIGFLAEYVFSIPALVAVGNEQAYKHGSPIKSDFEEVKKKLSKQKKQLARIEKMLTDLVKETKK